jgi:sugar/nucleoside kinase (ribokinase family)
MGAALVDILVQVDDAWVERTGSPKGGMTMVGKEFARAHLTPGMKPVYVPGGSACNTVVGYAKLGGEAAFISKVGDDELGQVFLKHLKDSGVESLLMKTSEAGTGQVLVAITPDAERSMFTYLGASDSLEAGNLTPAQFAGADFFYLEGYRAYHAECFRHAIRLAESVKAKVIVDFGAFGVVNDCRTLFESLFAEKKIDVIIANEEEAFAFTGMRGEEALAPLAGLAETAIVKVGSRGAYVSQGGKTYFAPAFPVQAVDTTGAGDLWAAGFLFGLAQHFDLEKCARLGNFIAAEVIQVTGPRIPEEGWLRIREFIKTL